MNAVQQCPRAGSFVPVKLHKGRRPGKKSGFLHVPDANTLRDDVLPLY
jgi:hypothetical protein